MAIPEGDFVGRDIGPITPGQVFKGKLTLRDPLIYKESRKTVTVQGEPDSPPSYGVPTIQDGIAIPYVIGQQRIFNPIVCWYGNLTPVKETVKEVSTETVDEPIYPETPTVRTKTTVETITVTTSIVGWKLDVQMALCLGPGVELLQTFVDEEVATSRPPNSSGQEAGAIYDSITFHNGNFDQPKDGNLVSWCGSKVPAYSGIAYVVIKGLDVTGNFPSLTFEVRRRPNPLYLSDSVNLIGNDINGATGVYDWLTNDWGAVGLDVDLIDTQSFIEGATQLAAEGVGLSMFIQLEVSGTNPTKEYEAHLRAFVYWDPEVSLVRLALLRDRTNPNDFFELNPQNVVDKPQLTKTSWELLPNKLPVTFTNRSKAYEEGSFSIDMPVGEEETKRIQTLGYPLAHTYGVAQDLAIRDAPYVTFPAWSIKVDVMRSASHLRPGDAVSFSWDDYRFGGVKGLVSLRNENQNDGQIELTIMPLMSSLEGFLVDEEISQAKKVGISTKAVAPQKFWAISAPFWVAYRSGRQMDPHEYIDFDVPLYLAQPGAENQKGYDVYQDNNSLAPGEWVKRDKGQAYAVVGMLAAPIDPYDGWENGVLPSLQLKGVPAGAIITGSGLQGVRQGQSFVVIGNEFMAYEGATQTGDTTWTLTNVHRALFGGPFDSHSTDANVALFGNDWGVVAKSTYPDSGTQSLKGVSSGIAGSENPTSGGLPLQNSWEPSIQLNAPYRVDNLMVNGVRSTTPQVIVVGDSFDIQASMRNRLSLEEVPLMTDPAHYPERFDDVMVWHRVYLTDSNGIYHLLDEMALMGFITVDVPEEAALGLGYVWVQVDLDGWEPLYQDRVPVMVT